jgi:hypothetical protein
LARVSGAKAQHQEPAGLLLRGSYLFISRPRRPDFNFTIDNCKGNYNLDKAGSIASMGSEKDDPDDREPAKPNFY